MSIVDGLELDRSLLGVRSVAFVRNLEAQIAFFDGKLHTQVE
jgi:hypothetical protein